MLANDRSVSRTVGSVPMAINADSSSRATRRHCCQVAVSSLSSLDSALPCKGCGVPLSSTLKRDSSGTTSGLARRSRNDTLRGTGDNWSSISQASSSKPATSPASAKSPRA
ncbi:MAG: hypothetical protein V5B38_04140 [Candidatus Accumulibacter propinquus]|jgi:hypothetical protein